MRVLIVGSGGREHALAWKLRQSPLVSEVLCAPGNGGTAAEGRNVPLKDADIPGLLRFIREESIDFVVPGPEAPLVAGLVDACRDAGIPAFGPTAYAARLEGSKSFAKEIMREAGVPTADFQVFEDAEAARAYVRAHGAPVVIKADGLAAGKGVVVAKTVDEALEAVTEMLERKSFGAAGEKVVIEDALVGEEVSFLCLCDGENVLPLPSAQDHKAVFDGDKGPNTGGMGAYSPAPILPEERYEAMADLAVRPVLRVLRERGHPFVGILYAGFMMTAAGPMVLEYNTRFGDPECQPLLMRLRSDLMECMQAAIRGELKGRKLEFTPKSALCVVMAAEGYPGAYPKGLALSGLEEAEAIAPGEIKVFQAGTRSENGRLVSSGGRVLGVTALGENLEQSRHLAYQAVRAIHMEKSFYRSDIGAKALKKGGPA